MQKKPIQRRARFNKSFLSSKVIEKWLCFQNDGLDKDQILLNLLKDPELTKHQATPKQIKSVMQRYGRFIKNQKLPDYPSIEYMANELLQDRNEAIVNEYYLLFESGLRRYFIITKIVEKYKEIYFVDFKTVSDIIVLHFKLLKKNNIENSTYQQAI